MKILSRTLFILIILTVSHLGFAQNSAVPTLRTEMEEIHDKFGANFIYDSSLEIDVPATKDVKMDGRTLEQCLDELFSGTDIQWSI